MGPCSAIELFVPPLPLFMFENYITEAVGSLSVSFSALGVPFFSATFIYGLKLAFNTYGTISQCMMLSIFIHNQLTKRGFSIIWSLVLVAPIVEELFRFNLAFAYFFPIFEFIIYGGGLRRIPALLFHYAVVSLPFEQRLLAHMLFNAVCVFIAHFWLLRDFRNQYVAAAIVVEDEFEQYYCYDSDIDLLPLGVRLRFLASEDIEYLLDHFNSIELTCDIFASVLSDLELMAEDWRSECSSCGYPTYQYGIENYPLDSHLQRYRDLNQASDELSSVDSRASERALDHASSEYLQEQAERPLFDGEEDFDDDEQLEQKLQTLFRLKPSAAYDSDSDHSDGEPHTFVPKFEKDLKEVDDMSVIRLIIMFVKQMRETKDTRAVQSFIHCITTAGVLYRGDFVTRVLTLINFINGLSVVGHREILIALLDRLCARRVHSEHMGRWERDHFNENWRPVAASDDEDHETNILESVNDYKDEIPDAVVIAIQKVFACAIASELFGNSTDDVHWAAIMAGILDDKDITISKNQNRFELAKLLRSTFMSVVTAIKTVMIGHEKDEFSCGTSASWMKCARWLIQYEWTRYRNGNVREGYVSDELWRKNLAACYEKYHKVLPKDPIVRSVMTPLYKKVAEMRIFSWCAEYGSRPMPFNIGLYSKPGTGKSTWIAEALAFFAVRGLKVNCDAESLDAFKKYMATINPGDKFMSSYHPARDIVVSFDEVGSTRADRDSENFVMMYITSILGENNWFPSRASVEEKGKILYQPYVNILMTNVHPKDAFGVRDYINNPEAFIRRIHVMLEVRIKPEFQAEGAHGIDFEKVHAYPDKWDVVTFHPYKASTTGFTELNETWSFKQAADYVTTKAQAHLAKKDGLREVRSQVDDLTTQVCEHGLFECKTCHSKDELVPTAGIDLEAMHYYQNQDQITYHWLGVLLCLHWFLSYFWGKAKPYLSALQIERERLREDLSEARVSLRFGDALLSRFTRVKQETMEDVKKIDAILLRVDELVKRIEKVKETQFQLKTDGSWRLLAGLMCAMAGVGIYKFVTQDKAPCQPAMNSQVAGIPPRTKMKGNKWDQDEGYIHKGSASCAGEEVLIKHVKRNLLEVEFIGTPNIRVHALGIYEQYALVNWHAAKYFAKGTHTCRVIRHATGVASDNAHMYNMKGSDYVVERIGDDLAVVRLVDLHPFKDIRNYIPEKAQYSGSARKVTGFNIHLRNARPYDYMKVPFTGYFTRQKSYKDRDSKYCPPGFFGDFPHPYDGHCGSPLITVMGNEVHLNGIVCAASIENQMSLFHTVAMSDIRKGVGELEKRNIVMSPCSGMTFQESPLVSHLETAPADNRCHVTHMKPEELGTMKSDGCLPNAELRTPKSMVYEYPLAKQLKAQFPDEYQHNLVAPNFKPFMRDGIYFSPERNAIKDLANQVTGIDMHHLNLAIKDVIEKFKTAEDFKNLRFLSLDECLNGDGAGIKSMPKNTSVGFPEKGKKHVHLEPAPTEKNPNAVKLTAEMQEKFDAMLKRACEGQRNGVVFKGCAKDEPRDAKKVKDRKIRLFTLGPMNYYLLCKKFFGSIMQAYTANFLTTETVGGVNCYSEDWGRIYKRLSKHPNVINGDFSKFDKKISKLMLYAACTVVHHLMVWAYFQHGEELTMEAVNAMKSIISDLASPLLVINRDLFRPGGSLSSGVLMTYFFNDICNSLYMRLAFYSLRQAYGKIPDQQMINEFRENVELFSCGDDNAISTSDTSKPYYNFKTIQAFFRQIGMAYTPADKSDNVYGTVPIEQATICKRKWRYDPEYKVWTCPIEKPSIMKMLTIGLKSTAITEQEHEQQCFRAAMIELAQHGREEFDARVETLKSFRPHYHYFTYDEVMLKQFSEEGITPWIPETLEPLVDVELDDLHVD